MMTVLQIVQEATGRCALDVPTTLVSSNDPYQVQLKGLFNEVMQKAVKDFRFQVCIFEPQWTSVATNIQGAIQTLWGVGEPESIVNATVWDFTLRRPIFGPLNDTNIQIIKALIPNGPIFQYRIKQNNLEIWPAPPAGNTHSAVIRTKNWLNLAGVVGNTSYFIQNDTDTPLIDDTTLIIGLKYRFKKEKGLPYADDERNFNDMLDNIALKDGSKEMLYLDKASQVLLPGIWVPSGNWPLGGGS